MDEETTKKEHHIILNVDEAALLLELLHGFEAKISARRSPPKGWNYGDVLDAMTTSIRIRAKLG